MKRLLPWTFVLAVVAVTAWGVQALYPCALESTFRIYLDLRFWQPLSKYEASLGKEVRVESRKPEAPFAGMSGDAAVAALREAGEAYRARDWARCRSAVSTALAGDLTPVQREEARLVGAKVDLRQGETGDLEALKRAGEQFRDFAGTFETPALRSEARGWGARVAYLRGDYPAAAKTYLDELDDPTSIFSREGLVSSLRMLFPYNGSSARLSDHLEDYFDTPAHALFVVNLVTNPVYNDLDERAAMAEVARKTLAILEMRSDLFSAGHDAEALVLALMRASLYMGDTRLALAYAERMPQGSPASSRPEYLWMTAACRFLQRDYAAAEAPLVRMLGAEGALRRDRLVASLGLIGVYQKLGRGADQLHAAVLYNQANREGRFDSLPEGETDYFSGPYFDFLYLPASGWLVDLSYLLDVQLEDKDLVLYLKRYDREARKVRVDVATPRERTAREAVLYARAVRLARQERYRDAAALFESIGARIRSERMTRLATLHAAAKDASLPREKHLEALFAYADFLQGHSTGVFFNDMLWYGFQRYMFLNPSERLMSSEDRYPPETDEQGLTGEERALFMARERRLRDDQEEYWRAYKLFVTVADEAGTSELGKTATEKAVQCLDRIRTDRFGREEEIESAQKNLRARMTRL